MKEWTGSEIKVAVNQHESFALYIYTPMCGTCQVASKMLAVVKEISKETLFVQCNINFAGEAVMHHQIESVPCLLLFKRGIMVKKIYAFRSVPYLIEMLQKYIDGLESDSR